MTDSIRKIEAVVFDLDDTLFPERQYIRSGYDAIGRHLCKALGRDEPFAQWLWMRFVSGKVQGAFDALSENFGLDLSKSQIGELVEVYRQHVPEILPFGGIADFLGKLRSLYKIGLLSDGFMPAQEMKFNALGIDRFFDEVLFTETLGRDAWKPSTIGFTKLSRRLGVADARSVYVGDNPAKDFVAPNKLGWLSVQWIRPGQVHSHKPAPDGGEPMRQVRSPGELYELLL